MEVVQQAFFPDMEDFAKAFNTTNRLGLLEIEDLYPINFNLCNSTAWFKGVVTLKPSADLMSIMADLQNWRIKDLKLISDIVKQMFIDLDLKLKGQGYTYSFKPGSKRFNLQDQQEIILPFGILERKIARVTISADTMMNTDIIFEGFNKADWLIFEEIITTKFPNVEMENKNGVIRVKKSTFSQEISNIRPCTSRIISIKLLVYPNLAPQFFNLQEILDDSLRFVRSTPRIRILL
jgi:hypothetical protein